MEEAAAVRTIEIVSNLRPVKGELWYLESNREERYKPSVLHEGVICFIFGIEQPEPFYI